MKNRANLIISKMKVRNFRLYGIVLSVMSRNIIAELLTICLLGIFFSSCPGPNPNIDIDDNSSKLAGILKANSWTARDFSWGEGNDDHVWADVDTYILYFETDEKGVLYCINKSQDTDLGNHTSKMYYPFTYNTWDDKYVYIHFDESTNYWTLTYSPAGILMQGDTPYVAKKMTSSDYELLKSIKPIEGSCGSNLKYSFDKRYNTLKIYGYGEMNNFGATGGPWRDLPIKTVSLWNEGGEIMSIGDNAFRGMPVTDIEYINGSNRTITRIGKGAFYGCLLRNVDLPLYLKELGDEAFADNAYLEKISGVDGEKMTKYGKYLFYGCKKLKFSSLKFGENVHTIDDFAFESINVGEISFKEGIYSIGTGAFLGTVSNKTLELPNSLCKLGATVFNAPNLNKIVIRRNLSELGKCAFITGTTCNIYINRGDPPAVEEYFIAKNGGWDNYQKYCNLYVPTGKKNVYSMRDGYRDFGKINEDSSLDGSGDYVVNNWNEVKYYYQNNEMYKMIYVDCSDNPELQNFYIMETEMLVNEDFVVDGVSMGKLNKNLDGGVIASEFDDFMANLREKTNCPFRIPSSEEWVYAAKGGKYKNNYIYSGSNVIGDVCWYSGNSGKSSHGVKLKQPNALGIYDMSGNFSELCDNGEVKGHLVDAPTYGGDWSMDASSCRTTSWEVGKQAGTIPGTKLKEKNAFDCKYITVRLVFSAVN